MTLIFLLRRTICSHLGRSRPEKILNVFPWRGSTSWRAWGWAGEMATDRLLGRSLFHDVSMEHGVDDR
jgi:hypothetical protein